MAVISPTVLVVDDNDMNLDLVNEFVLYNFPDAKVFKTTKGKKGLELAIQNDPDIVLLDIRMPGMNGFEVCSQIRANPSTFDVPVVFVTAYHEKENRVKALEAGANGFMTKPVDESELVAQIKTMVKVKAMSRQEKEEKNTLASLVAERTNALERELANREKAETLLRESEEKFAVAFKTSPFMMGIFSLSHGQYIEINNAFAKTLGYSLTDLQNDADPGARIWANLSDREIMLQTLRNGGIVKSREVRLRKSSGDELACALSAGLITLQGAEYVLLTVEDVSEIQKHQQTIADNEMRLRTLSENLPGFFYQLQIYNKDDIRVNHLSKGIEQFGITMEDALENPFHFFNLIRPEDFERLLKQNDDEVVKSTDWHEQFQITTPNGRKRWIEVHDVPRIEDDGSFVYNGYAFDITSRKQAEEKQARSEAQFQKLIENLPVSLSIVTLKGEVMYVNPKCRELFEIPDDFDYSIGTAFMYWVNADDRLRWIDEIQEKGEVKNLQLHIKSFKGKEIWAYGSGLFIQYKNETCIVATHQDITQVKLAQDALRESEEKFSKAFKSSPYMLIVTRVDDGKILEVNDAFTKISGYSRQEALESSTINLDIWVNPTDREAALEQLNNTGEIAGHEYDFRIKNGEIITGSLSSQIINLQGEKCTISSIEDITQRMQEERELRQSRQNFYRAFISSPVALAITNRNTGIIGAVNDSYCKIMEYTAEEVVGKSVIDLKIYQDPDERNRLLNQLNAENNIRDYELSVITKTGNLRYLLVSMEPIVYNDETSIISTFIDITDRKAAEAELKTNYALLQMAAKTARFGGWSVDLKTIICTWSDAVAEIHEMPVGYSPPVSEGISFYAPEYQTAITEAFSKCAQQGVPYDLELQIINRSGRRIWIRTMGEPVRDENGAITKVIGAFQDIDEQKNNITALQESEQKFRSLADNAKVLISIISMQGNTKYLYVNNEWERVTGYSKNEIDKITPLDIVHPDMRNNAMDYARQRLENNNAPNRYDLKIVTKNGITKTLDFAAIPITFENESVILTTSIDITDRKETEQELKERMDELERFQRITVGRELNMIALKKEINTLLEQNGKSPKYRIVE